MALFDNIEEIKKYNSSITMGLSLNSLQSFIDNAVDAHIAVAMSKQMLTELLQAKTIGIDPSSKLMELLRLTQKACAHFAIANYIPFGALLLSDSGAHVHSDTNLRPASDAKLDTSRSQSLVDGYAALEDLVNFLEDHLDDFPSYANSDAHRTNKQLFINSSKEFNKHAPVNITAQLFASIRGEIAHTERDTIEPILGEDVTASLRNKISNGELSVDDKMLITIIKRVVAPLSLAANIPYGCIRMHANGLSQSVDNTPIDSPAETNRMQQMMLHLTTRGEQELQGLRSFLNKKETHDSIRDIRKPCIHDTFSRVYLI